MRLHIVVEKIIFETTGHYSHGFPKVNKLTKICALTNKAKLLVSQIIIFIRSYALFAATAVNYLTHERAIPSETHGWGRQTGLMWKFHLLFLGTPWIHCTSNKETLELLSNPAKRKRNNMEIEILCSCNRSKIIDEHPIWIKPCRLETQVTPHAWLYSTGLMYT